MSCVWVMREGRHCELCLGNEGGEMPWDGTREGELLWVGTGEGEMPWVGNEEGEMLWVGNEEGSTGWGLGAYCMERRPDRYLFSSTSLETSGGSSGHGLASLKRIT